MLPSVQFCIPHDVLVASHNAAKHLNYLRQVFTSLQEHGLQIHPNKCVLGNALLDFLSFHVDQHSIRPLDNKVQVLKDFPLPPTQRKLRQFLGLVNFYHHFLPSCAQILRPFHDLKTAPKGNISLEWTDSALKAFKDIKEALASASLLVHLQPDAPTCILLMRLI